MRQYVVYTRVSTKEQGRSGLGLEAQERDINLYLEKFSPLPENPEEPRWEIVDSFCDVQPGSEDDRPALEAALALVRKTGAELLVAKLDRLSRDVAFIATLLKDRKVKLRVAQMPDADRFQLHIYAALAQQEREFISARTKAALQVAKERGVKLGGLRDATMKRNAVLKDKAQKGAEKVYKIIGPMRDANKTLAHIAEALNDMKVPTARGSLWSPVQVKRVLDRAQAT